MIISGSLEDDILSVFLEAGTPLNVLEIWDCLNENSIQIPVLYLNKVLIAMTRVNLLVKNGERFGQSVYHPTEFGSPGIRKTMKSLILKLYKGGKTAGAARPKKLREEHHV